jgi:hypothetical protein
MLLFKIYQIKIIYFLDGSIHIFPFQHENPAGPLRDQNSYLNDLANLKENKESHGVKGETLLNRLKYYNPTENTNIDFMHSVLEGVVKRFFKLWFDDVVREEHLYDFSLRDHKTEIDKRLLNIRTPSFIPVTPRSILDYKIWRANEFLCFLIYYMLPIFYDLMEARFYINITKLVVAVEFLLNREILKENLSIVKNILIDFVQEVEEIYPKNIMLSGMHELVHLVDCTLDFGPLNNVATFSYEEINRKIIQLIHGKDLIGDEFLINFSILQSLELFCQSSNKNTKFNQYLENHSLIKTSNKKKSFTHKCSLGPLANLTNDQFSKTLSFVWLKNLDISEMKSCTRLTYKGVLFTTSSNVSKRCDFCVVANNFYGLIDLFIITNNQIFVILTKINHLLSPFYDPKHPTIQSKMFICNISKEAFITTIDQLKKVAFIKINEDLCFISGTSISHLFL